MPENISTKESSVKKLTMMLRTMASAVRLEKRTDCHANGVSAEEDCLYSHNLGSEVTGGLREHMLGEAKMMENIHEFLNETDHAARRFVEGR